MKWKNKLKAVLANSAEGEKIAMDKKITLTKADETRLNVVSSAFVSDKLASISEKIENPPNCSNCGLEMELIENDTLWFCPFGCGSRKTDYEKRY